LLTTVLASALVIQAASLSPVAIPDGLALQEVIAERSQAFFTLYHDGCDPDRLRRFLLPTFEMYHDQNGVSASTAEPFVARYTERCQPRGRPGANRLRRVLRPDSFRVYPVPGYGAIEEGFHEYYGSVGGRPERKVTEARYLQLWALTPDGWRLARAFSYDHRDAPRLPPIPAGAN